VRLEQLVSQEHVVSVDSLVISEQQVPKVFKEIVVLLVYLVLMDKREQLVKRDPAVNLVPRVYRES